MNLADPEEFRKEWKPITDSKEIRKTFEEDQEAEDRLADGRRDNDVVRIGDE